MRALAILIVSVAILPTIACVSTRKVEEAPAIQVGDSGAVTDGVPAPPLSRVLGLRIEENESDSLEDLEDLPGVRIVEVYSGSAAALATLAAGDVLLRVDGVATDSRDAVEAILDGVESGNTVTLDVRRDTHEIQARPVLDRPRVGNPTRPLQRTDPIKTRAAYRSVVIEIDARRVTVAEVTRIYPRSPLIAAGIEVGDRIVTIDGQPVGSASGLVKTVIESRDFGQRVEFDVVRRARRETRSLNLWEPSRIVSRFHVPFLWDYRRSLKADSLKFRFLGAFDFRLFSYNREGGEREYRFLGLIPIRTGYGELVDETPGEGAR